MYFDPALSYIQPSWSMLVKGPLFCTLNRLGSGPGVVVSVLGLCVAHLVAAWFDFQHGRVTFNQYFLIIIIKKAVRTRR